MVPVSSLFDVTAKQERSLFSYQSIIFFISSFPSTFYSLLLSLTLIFTFPFPFPFTFPSISRPFPFPPSPSLPLPSVLFWLNRNNRKNRNVPVSVFSERTETDTFVSDSLETSFGSCFGYIETKPVLQDTLFLAPWQRRLDKPLQLVKRSYTEVGGCSYFALLRSRSRSKKEHGSAKKTSARKSESAERER
jgi:hypothetical protein